MKSIEEYLPRPLTTNKILKIQDKEILLMQKAHELEKTNLIEAINIYEELILPYLNHKSYKEGMILLDDCLFRVVAKPLHLADLYFKAKMFDKSWSLLNIILAKNISDRAKIRELQSKICSNEDKHTDALLFMMMSIVAKENFDTLEIGKEEKIEKTLHPKIKKANLLLKKDEILKMLYINMQNKNYELEFVEFFKKLIALNN